MIFCNQFRHLKACSTAASTWPGLLFQVPKPRRGIFVPLFRSREVSIVVLTFKLMWRLQQTIAKCAQGSTAAITLGQAGQTIGRPKTTWRVVVQSEYRWKRSIYLMVAFQHSTTLSTLGSSQLNKWNKGWSSKKATWRESLLRGGHPVANRSQCTLFP